MREISMMSPKDIVTKYGGNKKQIGEAVKAGLLNPTAAEMAGMMIDRIRAAAAQEQRTNTTVFEDTFGEKSTPYERPEVPSGGVAALPVDEDMYNMAGGGIVAFAGEDGSEVDLNAITKQINQASGRGGEDNLGRAREYVDLYRQLYGDVKRGPASEELTKFLEGYGPRAQELASKQRAATGLAMAAELLGTRGGLSKALAAAGKVGAPGLQKAVEMEYSAKEKALRDRAGLEEKGRLEELEAIKGGMGLYGKEQERLAGADRTTDFMRRYNLMLPEIMQRLGTNNPDDPKVKAATVKAVDASIGMAGQRVGVQQEGVGVRATEAGTNIETAVTASDEKINKEYNTRILMAQGDPEKEKSLIAERDAKKARRAAEIRRSGVGAAPTSGGAPTSAPTGLPAGAKQIGTSGGKPVFQLLDGSQVVAQ
jgi:hypothetical protein